MQQSVKKIMIHTMTFPFKCSEAFWTMYLQVFFPKGK